MYTVKQLSNLAGVTPRTLHHYDEIGLLKPSSVGDNGYRYYGEENLIQLQQILFYRELGLGLDEIKRILHRPDFDVLAALQEHRQALGQKVERLNRLIETVDDTILYLKGDIPMDTKQIFGGFTEEEIEQYAEEAGQMYDPDTVRESYRKWKSYPAEEKQRILDEGGQVYTDMVAVMDKGPASPEAQACVERWRAHMDYFWTPDLEQLLALAGGYVDDPRFRATFDKIHPELAAFIKDAVGVYVAKRR
ncbi:MAG: MerR family transcriptional regulator [Chloroflexota bacterium]